MFYIFKDLQKLFYFSNQMFDCVAVWSKCSKLNEQVLHIEKSKLYIADCDSFLLITLYLETIMLWYML